MNPSRRSEVGEVLSRTSKSSRAGRAREGGGVRTDRSQRLMENRRVLSDDCIINSVLSRFIFFFRGKGPRSGNKISSYNGPRYDKNVD